MVIDFGVKNRVVALWKSLSEASIQKAQNEPYSAHRSDELHRKAERSIKAEANYGQKLAKLPSCNEAR